MSAAGDAQHAGQPHGAGDVHAARALRVAILSIGEELVLGTALDTNSRSVAQALCDAGLDPVEHRTVTDRLEAIVEAMRVLTDRADVLVVTGGLGPTDDDLVREAVNALSDVGAPMIEDASARAALEHWFAGHGRTMAAINLRQAMRPRSARTLPNSNGTAPGLECTLGNCRVFCLPGPPREMLPMFEALVLPAVRPAGAPSLVRCSAATFGIGESALAERLGARMQRGREPSVGTTASGSIVSIHAVARGAGATARASTELVECVACAGPYAFGAHESTLAQALLEVARQHHATLAVAESCTGGLIGSMLTAVAGSSDAFLGGWITYSNAMKERELGVAPAMIAEHGAVSREVSLAMAAGACQRSGATLAIAVTGIAGPGGAVPGKPVGTLWIAVHDARRGAGDARRFLFPGAREIVRDRAAKTALQLARWHLLQVTAPLIWEQP